MNDYLELTTAMLQLHVVLINKCDCAAAPRDAIITLSHLITLAVFEDLWSRSIWYLENLQKYSRTLAHGWMECV